MTASPQRHRQPAHHADPPRGLELSRPVQLLDGPGQGSLAFGRTTIEALTLGRPVAGYAHGGVGEQLEAMLPEGAVKPGDRAAAADLLARWLADGGSAAPRPRANAEFTLDAMLSRTLGVYRELVSAPRGA